MSLDGCIPSNADVSGIGIRVNLYATTILMSLIPDSVYTERLQEVLIANAGVSGLALLITAIIQTAQHQLSLYHAIFIVHVLFFLGVNLLPSGKYRWTTARAAIAIITTYLIMFLFTSWAIYVWATAPTFGPNGTSCNNAIKYLVFFKPVRATVGWLRKLWLAGLGFGLVTLVYPMLVWVLMMCGVSPPPLKCGTGPITRIQIKGTLVAVYDVVMLELYVKHNKPLLTPGDNAWAFGQIMALIMIISTLNEVLHCFLSVRQEIQVSEFVVQQEMEAIKEGLAEVAMNDNVPSSPRPVVHPRTWQTRTGNGLSPNDLSPSNVGVRTNSSSTAVRTSFKDLV